MCVTLVGGMDRLHREYKELALDYGITLNILSGGESNLEDRFGFPDAAILVTDMVSHKARDVVMRKRKRQGIPVVFLRKPSASAMKQCLSCLVD